MNIGSGSNGGVSRTRVVYGYCRGCETWLGRDDMSAINVNGYDGNGALHKIPLRLCDKCWQKLMNSMQEKAWDNVLKTREELQATGENIEPEPDLESEAALRKNGVEVDKHPSLQE